MFVLSLCNKYFVFTLVTALFSAVNSFCQSYKPLLNGYKEWSILTCNNTNCLVDVYWLGKDTVVENNRYKVLEGYHFDKTVWIREDTATQRIYLKAIGISPLNPENLTYDFSLMVGDSMEVVNTQAPIPEKSGFFTVDSIKYLDYLGTRRKTMYLSGNDTSKGILNKAIWVEGIGSLSILNTPGLWPNHNEFAATICTFKDGQQIFRKTLSEDTCRSYYVDSSTNSFYYNTNQKFSLIPNPVSKQGFIRIKAKSAGTIHIRNVQGKTVLSKHMPTENLEFDLNGLIAPGVYYVVFNSKNTSHQIDKLIVID